VSRRAVFLDRDGTINRELDFVTHRDHLDVLPGARHAIARLAAAELVPIVVTNQSGIARGLYTERDLARIHERLHAETDGLLRAYLHCPHHPEMTGPYGIACACRKPGAGLLHRAVDLLGVKLDGSFVVGDSARDILMARDLPVQTVLVRCGKPWKEQIARLREAGCAPDHVAEDLAEAVTWVLASSSRT